MNALTKLFIVLGIIAVAAVGLLIWNTKHRAEEAEKATLTKVTKEDMELLLRDLPPMQLQQIASQPDGKKNIANELRELLSVANAAYKSGLADEPETKQQFAFMRQLVLAKNYDELKNKATPGQPPFSSVKQEEVDAFWQQSENEQKFQTFFEGFKKTSKMPQDLPEAQLKQLKDQWAKLVITAEAAEKDTTLPEDFKRKIEIQTKLQQSQFLAQKYAEKNLTDKTEPTEAEITAYLKEHPELDPATKKAKAEEVLQRVKNGEDFAKLADEFSEDPGNKDQKDGSLKGGFYEFSESDNLDPAFKQAMVSLEPGKVTENLVESQFGYHIIKLEDKKAEKGKDGKEVQQYKVRHILFSTTDGSNPFGPPQSMADKAKAAVTDAKRKKALEEIKAANPVEVAEDFEVKVPDLPPTDEMPDFGDPSKQPPTGEKGEKGKTPTKPETKKPEPKEGKK